MRNDSGFTLLEVMVAALIVGTSLFALVGMQAFSFGRNVDGREVTTASNLAADMIDRIEFNRRNVAAYTGIDTNVPTTLPPTSQPMARGDYQQWQTLLANSGLRNAQGIVAVTLQDPDPATNPTSIGRRLVTVSVNYTANKTSGGTRPVTIVINTVVAPE